MKLLGKKPSVGFLITVALVGLLWLSIFIPNYFGPRATAAKQWQPRQSSETNR
jgi:hypothetical protein